MTPQEKWLGNWCSAQLYALFTYKVYYNPIRHERPGEIKEDPEWVGIRLKEIMARIEEAK